MRPHALAAVLLGASIAAPVAAAEPAAVVLTGRVIDGTGAPPIENGRVVLRGDKVLCVGAARACPIPRGARRIDAGQGTILPGLIDLHNHPKPHYLSWFLPAGVTTIRVATTNPGEVGRLEAVGPERPEVVWAGPLVDGERTIYKRFFPPAEADKFVRPADGQPITDLAAFVATTPEQARAAVDQIKAAGGDWVKLYEQLPLPVYQAAAARARELGLPVMTDLGMMGTRGLKGAEVDALQAMDAGIDTLEHASGMALAYKRLGGDPNAETLDPTLIDKLARAVVDHRVTLVPTLSVFWSFPKAEAPDLAGEGLPMADVEDEIAGSLKAQWQAVRGHEAAKAAFSADFRLTMAIVRRVHELGGRLAVGSDTPAGAYNLPGGGVHKELELLVEAGLTPLEALNAATGRAAEVLGREDIGVIAAGRTADLVVVEGDPAKDIRDTRKVRLVVHDGRTLEPEALRRQALDVGAEELKRLMAASGGH